MRVRDWRSMQMIDGTVVMREKIIRALLLRRRRLAARKGKRVSSKSARMARNVPEKRRASAPALGAVVPRTKRAAVESRRVNDNGIERTHKKLITRQRRTEVAEAKDGIAGSIAAHARAGKKDAASASDRLPARGSDPEEGGDTDEFDLDALFASKKPTVPGKRSKSEAMAATSGGMAIKRAPPGLGLGSSVPGRNGKAGPARYTDEGYRVWTYDEIAADQPEGLNGPCPWDCSCCF
ncbi:hypothetical protein FVE85_3000 [Porphyridium purpureum]|uniref:Uncharacterized protein n=1 Tax=Porphyridium purpureum TaxID=35688 RepID=A0A5J4YTE3_PORPP|nr:hypothetical protein FVE85_3000 [Porphyridium purpureum]|eukprot:POR1394..scf227_4